MTGSPAVRALLVAVLGSALYGYALGSAHSELYALRNVVKFPLLLLGTGVVCALANHVLARTLAPTIASARVRHSVLLAYRDIAVLLAALSPCTGFLAVSMRTGDDGRLGEYPLFLAFNVGCIAASGLLAVWRQVHRLGDQPSTRRPALALIAASLALSLAVGGQVAFYMRPFFGLPVTRGGDPPFFLGDEPDARGARNFYEAVWQVVSSPPLPGEWGR